MTQPTMLERQLEASVIEVQRAKENGMSNIVRHEPSAELTNWRAMREQATELVNSGFLPKAVNTPEKAMAIIQTGRELGLGPMQALRAIHIIEGKPTMSADLIAGLALSRVPGSVLRVAESTNERCIIQAGRAGQETTTFTFSMKDAQLAGLTGKSNWKNYPRAMLRARCITEAARAIFPDAVMGLYDPDELGAITTETGQVAEIVSIRSHDDPHSAPDEDRDAPPRESPEFDAILAELDRVEDEMNAARTVTWDDVCRWRAVIGEKVKLSALGKRISTLYQSDELAPSQKTEMSKQAQRVHRALRRLEGVVPKPSMVETFSDEPEREPGEDD